MQKPNRTMLSKISFLPDCVQEQAGLQLAAWNATPCISWGARFFSLTKAVFSILVRNYSTAGLIEKQPGARFKHLGGKNEQKRVG